MAGPKTLRPLRVLSKRRISILLFLHEYAGSKGYQPKLEEIADGVGLAGPGNMTHNLRILRGGGYVDWLESRVGEICPRTVHLTEFGDAEVALILAGKVKTDGYARRCPQCLSVLVKSYDHVECLSCGWTLANAV